MREKAHAAKKLPVRVFHPSLHDRLIAEIVLKLQDVKGDHQAGVDSWRATARTVRGVESLLKAFPINFLGEASQGVTEVDDRSQLGFEDVALCGLRGFWQRGFSQLFEVYTPVLQQIRRHNAITYHWTPM
jgi:hypothetical protein